MSELEKAKLYIGESSDGHDDLITFLLGEAEKIIKGRTKTPKRYEHLKLEAVLFAWNIRGVEGSKSRSTIGFSESLANSIMSDFIKQRMPAPYVIK